MTEALVKVETEERGLTRHNPREVIEAASEDANVLAEVIDKQKLYSVISGRKFVKVEGWVTLATLRGCLPREVSVEEMPEGRYVAKVELVRMADGMVLTSASAECGGDGDRTWHDRPANARRSMAVTRATGKACRVAFSWVMALAGYEVTPAEEMDHLGANQQEQRRDPAPREDQAASRQQPARGASPAWRGKIVKAESKPVANGGTKYNFEGADGTRFGTFDHNVAGKIISGEGKEVEIVGEDTKYGVKIIEARVVES